MVLENVEVQKFQIKAKLEPIEEGQILSWLACWLLASSEQLTSRLKPTTALSFLVSMCMHVFVCICEFSNV